MAPTGFPSPGKGGGEGAGEGTGVRALGWGRSEARVIASRPFYGYTPRDTRAFPFFVRTSISRKPSLSAGRSDW